MVNKDVYYVVDVFETSARCHNCHVVITSVISSVNIAAITYADTDSRHLNGTPVV